MNLFILLFAYFTVSFQSTIILPQEFIDFSELNNTDFNKILTFVKTSHTQLIDQYPSSVKRQSLNGFNYKMIFQLQANCIVSVIAHTSINFNIAITSYESVPLNCQKIKLNQSEKILSSPQKFIAGGEQSYENLQTSEFQIVLAFIRMNHPSLQKMTPTQVKTQLVSGKNFKVTFNTGNNCSFVIKIYKNLENILKEIQNYQTPQKCYSNNSSIQKNITEKDHTVKNQQIQSITFNPVIYAPKLPKESQLAGGYSSYSDFNSNSFKKVLSFIYDNHPEIKDIKPKLVFTQIVSGMNFKLFFQTLQNCSIEIIIYQNIQGYLSQSSLISTPDKCFKKGTLKNNPQGHIFPGSMIQIFPTPKSQDISVIVGGYNVYNHTNSSQFQNVLSLIRANHNQLLEIDPSLVQRQVVNGFNYKVTFLISVNCSAIVVMYAKNENISETSFNYEPQNCFNEVKQENEGQELIMDLGLMGGYVQFEDLNSEMFNKILKYVVSNNPELANHRPNKVEIQIVNGINYKIKYNIQDYETIFIVYSSFKDELLSVSYQSNSTIPNNLNIKKGYQFALNSHHFLMFYKLKQSKFTYTDTILQLSFVGFDNYTKINLILDLKDIKTIRSLQFRISCINQTITCNPKILDNIYRANQYLIKRYPNLKNFALTTFKNNNKSETSTIIYQIFTNTMTKQKSIANFIVSQSNFKFLHISIIKS